MGAQTAEANDNAGVAAANQIVGFFEKGFLKEFCIFVFGETNNQKAVFETRHGLSWSFVASLCRNQFWAGPIVETSNLALILRKVFRSSLRRQRLHCIACWGPRWDQILLESLVPRALAKRWQSQDCQSVARCSEDSGSDLQMAPCSRYTQTQTNTVQSSLSVGTCIKNISWPFYKL